MKNQENVNSMCYLRSVRLKYELSSPPQPFLHTSFPLTTYFHFKYAQRKLDWWQLVKQANVTHKEQSDVGPALLSVFLYDYSVNSYIE